MGITMTKGDLVPRSFDKVPGSTIIMPKGEKVGSIDKDQKKVAGSSQRKLKGEIDIRVRSTRRGRW